MVMIYHDVTEFCNSIIFHDFEVSSSVLWAVVEKVLCQTFSFHHEIQKNIWPQRVGAIGYVNVHYVFYSNIIECWCLFNPTGWCKLEHFIIPGRQVTVSLVTDMRSHVQDHWWPAGVEGSTALWYVVMGNAGSPDPPQSLWGNWIWSELQR